MIVTISLIGDRVEKCHQTIVKQSRGLQRNSLLSNAAQKTSSHCLKPTSTWISEKREKKGMTILFDSEFENSLISASFHWNSLRLVFVFLSVSITEHSEKRNKVKKLSSRSLHEALTNSSITLIHWETPSGEIPWAAQQRPWATTHRCNDQPLSSLKRTRFHRRRMTRPNSTHSRPTCRMISFATKTVFRSQNWNARFSLAPTPIFAIAKTHYKITEIYNIEIRF